MFETPELIGSLAEYSESRQPAGEQYNNELPHHVMEPAVYNTQTPMLLLQIFAAADYYTMNRTLMEQVPPILADIILDPFLFNVFPRSLIPTATYIAILAIGAWYLSKYISELVQRVSQHDLRSEKKE